MFKYYNKYYDNIWLYSQIMTSKDDHRKAKENVDTSLKVDI